MKKIFTLIAMALMAVGANAQTVIYSWESPDGTAVESGGKAEYVNGDGDSRVNYKNTANEKDYYTICLNGKKANIGDATASNNAGKIVITLEQELAADDVIAITAYLNKNESKETNAYILFKDGVDVESPTFADAENIGEGMNGAIGTKSVAIPAGAVGCKTITMTRGSKAGTNLFITKLQIIRGGEVSGGETGGEQSGSEYANSWNFSETGWTAGDITTNTTINGLTLTSTGSDSKWTIDGSNKSVEGVSYSQRLKSGGTGGFSEAGEEKRTMKFDVTGDCTIYIDCCSASSSEERSINIYTKAYTKESTEADIAKTIPAVAGNPVRQTYSYTGSATTITIQPAGGSNFYGIFVKSGATGITKTVFNANDVNAPAYNLAGQKVDKSYKGVVIQNGKKMIQK
jgi:hypothetical protein